MMKSPDLTTLRAIAWRGLALVAITASATAQNPISGSLLELDHQPGLGRLQLTGSFSELILSNACMDHYTVFDDDQDPSVAYSAAGDTISCNPFFHYEEEIPASGSMSSGSSMTTEDMTSGSLTGEFSDGGVDGDEEIVFVEDSHSYPPPSETVVGGNLESMATGACSTEALRIGAAPVKIQVDHSVASLATTSTVNGADACAYTSGFAVADYQVLCPPEAAPEDQPVLEGNIYVNIMPDETGSGSGYGRAGTSSVCVTPHGTTSVKAYIDLNGEQAWHVTYTAEAEGALIHYAELTECNAVHRVDADACIESHSWSWLDEIDVAGTAGTANANAAVNIYEPGTYAGLALPGNLPDSPVIEVHNVSWVTHSFPGDACMIDPFAGPSDGCFDDGYGDDYSEEGDGGGWGDGSDEGWGE